MDPGKLFTDKIHFKSVEIFLIFLVFGDRKRKAIRKGSQRKARDWHFLLPSYLYLPYLFYMVICCKGDIVAK